MFSMEKKQLTVDIRTFVSIMRCCHMENRVDWSCLLQREGPGQIGLNYKGDVD